MTNQYEPWVSEGITDSDYFKKRYIEARSELAASQEREARLRGALEFYADKKNWSTMELGEDLDWDDYEALEPKKRGRPQLLTGGKRARKALSSTHEPRMLTELKKAREALEWHAADDELRIPNVRKRGLSPAHNAIARLDAFLCELEGK